MNKKLVLLLFVAFSLATYAQNATDVLRLSQDFYTGTARSAAISGAFSGVGGDFSVASTNPAGLAVFRGREFTFTPNFTTTDIESSYKGNSLSENAYKFGINSIGLVTTYKAKDESNAWKNINIGIGYNKLNDFNRNIQIEGINTEGSMIDQFVANSQGIYADNLYPNHFEEEVSFLAFLTDTLPGEPTNYVSIMQQYDPLKSPTYGEIQRKTINSNGYSGEYTFSLSTNYEHILYLGATFGIRSVRYEESWEYMESDPNDAIDFFDSFTYTQHLETTGSGYDFKFGMLLRPTDWLRIGGAFHTPVFYNLHDEYENTLTATLDASNYYLENDDLPTKSGVFDYEITSSPKAMASLAFVLGKSGFITLDYEFIDYSKGRLRGEGYSFYDENNEVESIFTSTSNIRGGAEYKFGPFALRTGLALYGSPYESSYEGLDLAMTQYSFGLGIREKAFSLDFAYVNQTWSESQFLYNVFQDETLVEAKMDNKRTQFLCTLGYKF